MELFDMHLEENIRHLKAIAEQTQAGKLKWECTEYNPISFMDEDPVDETSAYLSQSFELKAEIEGIPYTLEIIESIDVPSGMSDIAVTLTRDIPDDFMRIDSALGGNLDEYDDCRPEDLKERFQGESPTILSDTLIPLVASSECVHSAFSWARFYYGGEIPAKMKRHPLLKLGAMLFQNHRVVDFHRCVLDTEYRTLLLKELK